MSDNSVNTVTPLILVETFGNSSVQNEQYVNMFFWPFTTTMVYAHAHTLAQRSNIDLLYLPCLGNYLSNYSESIFSLVWAINQETCICVWECVDQCVFSLPVSRCL